MVKKYGTKTAKTSKCTKSMQILTLSCLRVMNINVKQGKSTNKSCNTIYISGIFRMPKQIRNFAKTAKRWSHNYCIMKWWVSVFPLYQEHFAIPAFMIYPVWVTVCKYKNNNSSRCRNLSKLINYKSILLTACSPPLLAYILCHSSNR